MTIIYKIGNSKQIKWKEDSTCFAASQENFEVNDGVLLEILERNQAKVTRDT